ncbi:MAG: N-acylneuraminate cytidylyltransferase [Butyrivibrio sp.]|uniref:N-acylneuraminate cytidylyltransferase n=1 Tax=Butyrivibrio sp. TaxID=28121 RepID=UPI001B195AE4|nr:N-acylneuraminate cytidylyltransferase [Butyrivibrio sp.]MBO6241720.1 N-acylneuraminate cytidylyltransferase [Butyrivibrio sp.]
MNVAFIPVRGGSKSIPLKNIKIINGRPLVYWTVKAACECKYIDKVYVATDSDVIKETVESFKKGIEADLFLKVEVIGRSAESASDTAPTEHAMLEFAEKFDFDNIVLVQATSPLLQVEDLNRGFDIFKQEDTDSVLSVVRQKRFQWINDENGFASPSNYDVFHRPRRQEFNGYLVENGAFYINSKDNLLRFHNRVSGNIRVVEMSEETFFEIDEPSDWIIIEALMKKNGITAPSERPDIRIFLTDCDGCLTDGGMYYSEHGDELKKFNTKDGMGFKILKQEGILTGIITSENVELNRRRAEKLKLDVIEAGCKDKFTAIKRICKEYGVSLNNVCYIGDDINDMDAIKMVGFGCCPANALPQVKSVAKYITKANGGEGVIREVVELIMGSENI